MLNILIGLVVIALLVDVYSFRQIKQGLPAFETAEEDVGWVCYNMILCLVIGSVFTVGYYLLGEHIVDGKGIPFAAREVSGMFLVTGGLIWLVNMVIMSVVVNCCLEGYVEYKKGCLRLNLDLRDNIQKYFVLTSKGWCEPIIDGLARNNEVNLYKVMYNRTWLGIYPYLHKVTTLVILADVELQKDKISEYVQKYFDARGQYEVNGGDLIALEDKPMDVIVIK